MDLKDKADEQVVILVRQTNQEYFAEIIKRYQTKLNHYLRKFVIDSDERDDVLQSVFIKTFKNLNDFKTDKKFSSWIYRIAHNEAINHIKKNKNNISLDEFEIEVIEEKFDIARDVDNAFLSEKIKGALGKLKSKYKDPLVLFYFEQLSYEEIGDILKIPKNTVGTLISRAKKQLKSYL